MTLYRASVLDTPDDPFAGGVLRSEEDAGLLVRDGVVRERGPFDGVRGRHPDEPVSDLRRGVLIPGLVDAHVHFPQTRVMAGLGMPLLTWLEECALPEEARLADEAYARGVADDFLRCLTRNGTTSALVFGSHFPAAVDVLLTDADRVGVRLTAGLVVSDRSLRPELLTTPERAYSDARHLAERWHGRGRIRYAVTPRFSYSASEGILEACAAVLEDVPGTVFTSHVNEHPIEIAHVRERFPEADHYVDTYLRHGLLGPWSVLAHDVHPTDDELGLLAASGAAIAHCPTSNAALGSGLFPMRRHLDAGVHVALGSDVGAGTGFLVTKEALQAYFHQQLLGDDGVALGPAHLLHLATRAGARALGLGDVGDLGEGRAFDAVLVEPEAGGALEVGLRHAPDPEVALARVIALTGTADIARVWVGGDVVHPADGDSGDELPLDGAEVA